MERDMLKDKYGQLKEIRPGLYTYEDCSMYQDKDMGGWYAAKKFDSRNVVVDKFRVFSEARRFLIYRLAGVPDLRYVNSTTGILRVLCPNGHVYNVIPNEITMVGDIITGVRYPSRQNNCADCGVKIESEMKWI